MSVEWKTIKEYTDIRYERADEGITKITINRPEVRNAFRPETVSELIDAFNDTLTVFTAAGDDGGGGAGAAPPEPATLSHFWLELP